MVSPPSPADVRAMAYFDGLADDDIDRFTAELIVRAYRARELVVVQGEVPKGFYYVRSGKGRIFRTGIDGREQTLRLTGPGDTFGEVPVFDGGVAPSTVEALEPMEVILVPSESFIHLLQRNPQVGLRVLHHFARRIRSFTELIEQISLQTVQSRLARYLYMLAREEGTKTAHGIIVRREITQHDLASLLGSVREVVGRTLKSLEAEGLMTVRRKEIVIHDLDGLRDLA